MTQLQIHLAYFLLIMTISLFEIKAQKSSEMLDLDRIFLTKDFKTISLGPVKWMGDAYTRLETAEEIENAKDIVRYDAESGKREVLVSAKRLIPQGQEEALSISDYSWSKDGNKLLVFTNTRRVWRIHTRGDYWVLNLKSGNLQQLGKDMPKATLMFAKFSPDGESVAYVSRQNIYVEALRTGKITALTTDGTDRFINGTFDWAYEEEFRCRDGFRWSPDGKHIAFWQIDARDIKNFYMINNTDSIYSEPIPLEYPKVGETPSACRVGVISSSGGGIKWMNVPGDNRQHYIPRMEWANNSDELIIQQLNRKQNTNKVMLCDIQSGETKLVTTDRDETWVAVVNDWQWLDGGKAFMWVSESDGWRHAFRISRDGQKQTLITVGDYDAVEILEIDEENGYLYFIASPDNPAQRFLYRIQMNGKGEAERMTPASFGGTHAYNISPSAKYAIHTYSDANTPPKTDFISLPDHKVLRTLVDQKEAIKSVEALKRSPVEFFRVKTEDGIDIDGYMIKPPDFDEKKKYPVLFYVYGEPAGQTARDRWGGDRHLWHTMLTQQGYIVITMDNRGQPAPRGREWRKSIYRKIGIINAYDQSQAAKEVLNWDFIDPDRVGVWGWSGGGSMTLNLLFKYPEIYKMGMSVAPVGNQLLYDNIYQERYMGLPQENREDFIKGSPVTYAKHLEGDLLLVHGTGDDNVHYQNSEVVINELIKHNKQFQMMAYPNRTHSIKEGENTTRHLYSLLTKYLLEHMPPGVKGEQMKVKYK